MEREVMDLQDGQEETCLKCSLVEGNFKGIKVKGRRHHSGSPGSQVSEVAERSSLNR